MASIGEQIVICPLEFGSEDDRRCIFEKCLSSGRTVQQFAVQPDVVLGNHSHDGEEIFVIFDGTATVAVRDEECDETYEVEPGWLVFIPAHCTHAFKSGPDGFKMVALKEKPPGQDNAIRAEPPLL